MESTSSPERFVPTKALFISSAFMTCVTRPNFFLSPSSSLCLVPEVAEFSFSLADWPVAMTFEF